MHLPAAFGMQLCTAEQTFRFNYMLESSTSWTPGCMISCIEWCMAGFIRCLARKTTFPGVLPRLHLSRGCAGHTGGEPAQNF
jgi:hypothetical protein